MYETLGKVHLIGSIIGGVAFFATVIIMIIAEQLRKRKK